MWNLFKKLFLFSHFFRGSESLPEASDSIQKLVNYNALNKRKNIRIKYPPFGAIGPYPRVHFQNSEMIVSNISVGGILIIDDTEKLGSRVGEVIVLDIAWDDFTSRTKARIVGANLSRRHLQFEDFNAQAFLRISKLSKPAYLGGRFHRVRDDLGQVSAKELWVGPSSESLVFYKDAHFAELTINGEKITFDKDKAAYFSATHHPLSKDVLTECLIIVANLPEHTELVKELLDIIENDIRSIDNKRKTG